MVLLCPSWSAMQELLCQIVCFTMDIDMVFNVSKTKCMVVKPKENGNRFLVNIPQFVLSGMQVDFCSEFKYLGHVLVDSWNDVKDMNRELKVLYIRADKMIGRFSFCSHNVKKVLWNSYINCLYGAGLWNLTSRDKRMYIIAYNKCIKRFFGVSKFERNRLYYLSVGMLTPNTILYNSACLVKRCLEKCGVSNCL